MEARFLGAALAIAAVVLLGAGRPGYSVRSQHFIVTAPTPQLAQEVCQAAESYRRDLAIEWLGHELPPWRDLCPISVKLDPGAGGATSFVFQGGFPTQWTMQVQGSRERILDSVLPHEITHTVFATHFGRPLPRWADEGGATTVEHASEKAKQDRLLIQFLSSQPSRGIAFNRMFAMKEYPHDMLPLYSQGYSLARYLIQQGGKRKFVEYVGDGMRTNNWPAATRKYYGYRDLSQLQLAWVDWVRQGSPTLADGSAVATVSQPAANVLPNMALTQMASLTQQPRSRIPDGALSSWQTVQAQNARALAQADAQQMPSPPDFSAFAATQPAREADFAVASRPVSDGWYARRRDQAQAALRSSEANTVRGAPAVQERPARDKLAADGLPPQSPPTEGEPSPVTPVAYHAPQGPPSRRVLLEWTRPADHDYAACGDLTGVSAGGLRR